MPRSPQEERVREQRSRRPALRPQSEGKVDSTLDLPAGPSAGREERPPGSQAVETAVVRAQVLHRSPGPRDPLAGVLLQCPGWQSHLGVFVARDPESFPLVLLPKRVWFPPVSIST